MAPAWTRHEDYFATCDPEVEVLKRGRFACATSNARAWGEEDMKWKQYNDLHELLDCADCLNGTEDSEDVIRALYKEKFT